MRFKKYLFIALALALCLALAGCDGAIESTGSAGTSQAAQTEYTVTFLVGGTVYDQQTVPQGECPTAETPQAEGLDFLYWADESGAEVSPDSIPVTGDVTYTACGYPQLTTHAPFLFTDSSGALDPDGLMTKDAVQKAFNALAASGAWDYFPKMPAGDTTISAQELTELLYHFFPAEAVDSAASGLDGDVTRVQFAVAMCQLLERTEDGDICTDADAELPTDVDSDTAQLGSLLEAAIVHTHGESGTTWSEYVTLSQRDPGFFLQNGYLYYVNEDGKLLRDGTVGLLYFGTDGRYTCGDEELDTIVADILAQIIADNPEMTRFELLYEAFVYCRDSFTYLRKEAFSMGQTGWEIESAKIMFTGGRGNCYNYAATFWALARGLGYDARAVSGVVLSDEQPHGWVFIEFDGEDYIFDCEWEMAYRVQHDPPNYDMNMFMIPSSKWSYWRYQW